MDKFFAVCPRGLEPALEAEIKMLGADDVQVGHAGVSFQEAFSLCYKANLYSRIASRILWQRLHASYRDEDDIYDAVSNLSWHEWFPVTCTIRVHVAAKKCPLKSLDFVTLRIKDAVCDAFRDKVGDRPSVKTHQPDIGIHAFLDEENITLYIDTSGEPLFKRGLRNSAGEAPLRENLAAGILYLSGWQPDIPLLDPMCGSGTFLLEAVQIALDIAPGINRHFAFEQLSNYDEPAWQEMRGQALAQQDVSRQPEIFGSDLYGDALKDARQNLAEAGLEDYVKLKQANVLELSAPAPNGIMVTNPPYGVRLEEQNKLAEFYPKLGDVLKKKFGGWNAYIFSADMRLPKLIGLKASRRIPLFNGGLECRLFEYRIVEGSMRRKGANN